MPAFNQFKTLPYVPYKIVEHLAYNNENIWKMLKYSDYDCMAQPNLTFNEKLELVWRGQSNQQEYNVFLNRIVEDAEPRAKSLVKIYRLDTNPKNHLLATTSYEFDFLFGSKISLMEYNGLPCNRGDVFESELMQTLNGIDVAGVGLLQFNHGLSTLSRSGMNLGNNKTFSGISIVMAVQNGTV